MSATLGKLSLAADGAGGGLMLPPLLHTVPHVLRWFLGAADRPLQPPAAKDESKGVTHYALGYSVRLCCMLHAKLSCASHWKYDARLQY